jgi:hypothetical protein
MSRERIEVDEEIAAAAQWLQEQVDAHAFCDAGVTLSVHDGTIRRVDHSLTTKTKATDRGGHHAYRNR